MTSWTLFHFLRPQWLLLLPPLLWLCYYLWQKQKATTDADAVISRHLVHYLTMGKTQKQSQRIFIILAVIWLLVCLALAGPTWQRRPQPLYNTEAPLIIALDLSPSMRAEDTKPSRIERARFKIQTLLKERKEGLTALLVYAGEAHVVVPFTSDNNTIDNLLPTLSPGILPIPGSNPEMAITLAEELLNRSAIPNATVLLVSDDITADAVSTISRTISEKLSLTILGIGTESGAPIPYDNGFLKDDQNTLVLSKRSSELFNKLAQEVGGYYLPMQMDDSDIDFIVRQLSQTTNHSLSDNTQAGSHNQWIEAGPWLLLLLLPVVALAFRRGVLLSWMPLVIILSTVQPSPASAASWDWLWKNREQRAQQALESNDYSSAAQLAHDPLRQGSALYLQKNYEQALEAFSEDQSATGHYNRGNALAQLQRYKEAIDAYEQALIQQPDFPQAQSNKKKIEELLKRQQSEKQKSQSDSSQPADSKQSSSESSNENNTQKKEEGSQKDEKSEAQKNQKSQRPSSESDEKNDNEASETVESLKEKSQNEENELVSPRQQDGNTLSDEENQAMQQWLRKIPDDPSGLLRRKFEYEFQQRRRAYQQGEWQLPDNNAHKRY